MTYATGEALILTQVRNLTAFDANNSSRGIYSILNSGSAKSYVILRPGAFEHYQKGLGGAYETTWTTVCELFVKLKDYGETLDELVDRRQEIMGRFDMYPHAGDSTRAIEDITVISAGDILEIASATGSPIFIKQELTIQWRETNNVTLQE